MESKHTPGPWHISGYCYKRDESAPTGRRVHLVSNIDSKCDGFTINAANHEICHLRSIPVSSNARLIASAPELLAALEAMLAYGVDDANYWLIDNEPLESMARAAIAKAKGE